MDLCLRLPGILILLNASQFGRMVKTLADAGRIAGCGFENHATTKNKTTFIHPINGHDSVRIAHAKTEAHKMTQQNQNHASIPRVSASASPVTTRR